MKMFALGTVLFGALLSAGSTKAQVPAPERPAQIPCPYYGTQIISMTAPTPFPADFSQAALSAQASGLNDPTKDRVFLHSFQWARPDCCRIMSAYLTVVTRSNLVGNAPRIYFADAGNDTISIVSNGASIPGMGGLIYATVPIPINHLVTTTIVVNAAGLASMNANDRLSFGIQDDTRVLSADLRIDRCCLYPPRSR